MEPRESIFQQREISAAIDATIDATIDVTIDTLHLRDTPRDIRQVATYHHDIRAFIAHRR